MSHTLCWCDHSDLPLDWNGPIHRPFDRFPDEAKTRPIIELLAAVVARNPERIALVDAEGSITYAELWRSLAGWAERIAAATADDDLVGILAPVSSTSAIAMLACLAAGRPFVALDPDCPADWLAHVLRDARPALLLRPHSQDQDAGASPGWRPTPVATDRAACVLFTSGSTGRPKGIVNSQRNLLQRVSQSINSAHINCDDTLLSLTSLSTIVGVRDLITALLAGASMYLLDLQQAGAREVPHIIREQRVSILFAFPALLRSVLACSQVDAGDRLRLVRIGGDTTLWSDIAWLRGWMAHGTSIQIIYAATEAPMMQWFVGDITPAEETRVPIGYPLPGNALAVVDEAGMPTPDGEVGELLVCSHYIALGTWSQGRCVAEHLDTDAEDGSLRIHRTGDLVRRRPDGLFDRIGRKDRQVKIRGARVELDGVEAAIRQQQSVRDVAVLARSDDAGDAARLVAYVQLDDAAPGDSLAELRRVMRRSLPQHMRPWRYYATQTIPRLNNSKLDLRGLLAMDRARSREESDAQRRSPCGYECEQDRVAMRVAHVWRDVLGLELTAPTDDFFDLGGDSFGAITMTLELEQALGRELPMNLINQAPTFAAFCAVLRENRPVGYDPLVVLKPGQGSPPLFVVHGVGGGVMELFALGRQMSWPGPVIAIQARGLDGRDAPHDSVEAMADEYLAAMKARQPEGPYLLCGYSFGGLIAFELARRLSAGGDEVAFVGLLATLPPGHGVLRAWTWAAYLYRRLAHGVAQLTDRSLQPADTSELEAAGALADLQAVAVRALSASAAYQPGTYAGELTIIEPRRRDLGLPSSALLWRPHARALRRHSLPGRHDDMLVGPNAQTAANLLTQCLEAACSSG